MKKILFVFTLFSLIGCSAALQERLSTDNFEGAESDPYVSEHTLGIHDHFGVQKRLLIHNPLPYGIEVVVQCSSMYQSDPTVHVGARKVRFVLITAPASAEFGDSCYIVRYTHD